MTYTPQHRAEASTRLSSLGKRFFELIEFDDTEELVTEIRKHSFGLFIIVLSGLIVSCVVALTLVVLAFNLDIVGVAEESLPTVRNLLVGLGIGLSGLGIIATVISVIVYRSSVIFVTSDKIAQVLYRNIIDRKISQLSIGDVQDVTVTQKGIFARLFNFGTLVVETAGEQQNYTFTYVPKPYENAKAIVGAHEENLRKYGN